MQQHQQVGMGLATRHAYDTAIAETALAFPPMLDLELSAKCNLRCSFCHLNWFKIDRPTQFTLAMLDEFITPFLAGVESLSLFRNYEPLTCKEFAPIINRINEFGIKETYFSTNGLLLSPEKVKAIVGHLTYMTVSVNGFSRETYKRDMSIDGFDALKERLDLLNQVKKAAGTNLPLLRISVVGKLDSLDELKMAIDFAHQYQAEEGIRLIPLQILDESQVDQRPILDKLRYSDKTREAIAYAKLKGVRFELTNGDFVENEHQTSVLGHSFCRVPWNRLSVDPTGDVYPCNVSTQSIGNFFETPLNEIWQSQQLASFRARVNNVENMNPDCQTCAHCRIGSISIDDANRYNKVSKYIGGLKRFRTGAPPKRHGKAPAIKSK